MRRWPPKERSFIGGCRVEWGPQIWPWPTMMVHWPAGTATSYSLKDYMPSYFEFV